MAPKTSGEGRCTPEELRYLCRRGRRRPGAPPRSCPMYPGRSASPRIDPHRFAKLRIAPHCPALLRIACRKEHTELGGSWGGRYGGTFPRENKQTKGYLGC